MLSFKGSFKKVFVTAWFLMIFAFLWVNNSITPDTNWVTRFAKSFNIKAQNSTELMDVDTTSSLADNKASSLTYISTYLSKAFCSDKAGTTEFPYRSIVLVDLNNYYPDFKAGILNDGDALSEFLYEFLYIDQYRLWPFNAISISGNLYKSTCDKWDFMLNPYVDTLKDSGIYVLGFFGDLHDNINVIRELTSKYKFDSVYTAKLKLVNLNNKQVLLAEDLAKCKKTCFGVDTRTFGLYKNAIYARPINLAVEKVEYEHTIKSLSKTKVKLTIRNNSDATLLSNKYYSIYVKELSNANIPDLYVKTWDSLHIPVHVNKQAILPHQTVTVSFDIGPYVYPRIYSGNFALYLDNKKLSNTNFSIKVKVDRGKMKLGYIKGRDLSYVNVHAKPNLKAPVSFKLDVGEYVIVNKVDGAWVNITAQYGDTGWVYRPMIRIE